MTLIVGKFKLKDLFNFKKLFGYFFILLLSFTSFLSPLSRYYSQAESNNLNITSNIGKSLDEEYKENEERLKQIAAEREKLANEKATISKNLTVYQQQIVDLGNKASELTITIEEKEIEIRQLEIQVEQLTEQIEILNQRIEDAKDQIAVLEKETDSRLLNMYINQKQNSSTSSMIFTSGGPSSFVKGDTYRQALQEDTNKKLELLQATRKQLEEDQVQIEEDKTNLDRNRESVENEKITLDIKRTEAKNQQALLAQKQKEAISRQSGIDELIATMSEEEKKLIAEQDAIQSARLTQGETANGRPIKKGAFVGIEGQTGYAYGPHLHFGVSENGIIQNPCNYLPSGAYGSCGGNGKVGKPLSSATLTSGFRTKDRPSHNAIDISSSRDGGASVVAAHDGYVYFGFEPCPKTAKVCNGGGAIIAKVCEVDGCGSGIATVYYHLSCTAEGSSSNRGCKK